MTKICGLVGNRDDFNPLDPLRRMYEASWQDTFVRREVWHDHQAGLGHFSLGAVNTKPQPLFSADGDNAIVYCGKIFDYADLANKLSLCNVNSLTDDVEFMLGLLSRSRKDLLPKLNGVFSLAWWSKQQRKLVLINDRFGLRPIYYHHNQAENILVFASDLRALLATPRTPRKLNWTACSVFLHFGHHLGEDTFLENVFLLPPASILTFQDNTVVIKRYWDIARIPIDESVSYSQAVEGCTGMFARAIGRRARTSGSKTIVFLSGGLDSGRIAAELKKQACPFVAYTTRGFSLDNSDRDRARAVADLLGVEHHFINLPSRGFTTTCFPQAAVLCDNETRMHQWILPLVQSLPPGGLINYDGLGGDISFNAVRRASRFIDAAVFSETLSMTNDHLAEELIPELHDFSILHPDISRHLHRAHVVQAVARELEKYDHTPNKLGCYYLMNRSRRATALASLKLVSLKAESFFPFFDNDLFDFVMGLPPLMRIQNKLRLNHVERAYPRLAQLYASLPKITYEHDDIRYHHQRQVFWWFNLKRHFIRHNQLFNNGRAAPRLLRDALMIFLRKNYISYPFNLSFIVFFEFLERYFPDVKAAYAPGNTD
ncbi:MAG: asparagine synthetase B [Sedimentisphaerales bacterium]|nr:asparagine synthetase B [Sedimentisphaerales bacterium]